MCHSPFSPDSKVRWSAKLTPPSPSSDALLWKQQADCLHPNFTKDKTEWTHRIAQEASLRRSGTTYQLGSSNSANIPFSFSEDFDFNQLPTPPSPSTDAATWNPDSNTLDDDEEEEEDEGDDDFHNSSSLSPRHNESEQALPFSLMLPLIKAGGWVGLPPPARGSSGTNMHERSSGSSLNCPLSEPLFDERASTLDQNFFEDIRTGEVHQPLYLHRPVHCQDNVSAKLHYYYEKSISGRSSRQNKVSLTPTTSKKQHSCKSARTTGIAAPTSEAARRHSRRRRRLERLASRVNSPRRTVADSAIAAATAASAAAAATNAVMARFTTRRRKTLPCGKGRKSSSMSSYESLEKRRASEIPQVESGKTWHSEGRHWRERKMISCPNTIEHESCTVSSPTLKPEVAFCTQADDCLLTNQSSNGSVSSEDRHPSPLLAPLIMNSSPKEARDTTNSFIETNTPKQKLIDDALSGIEQTIDIHSRNFLIERFKKYFILNQAETSLDMKKRRSLTAPEEDLIPKNNDGRFSRFSWDATLSDETAGARGAVGIAKALLFLLTEKHALGKGGAEDVSHLLNDGETAGSGVPEDFALETDGEEDNNSEGSYDVDLISDLGVKEKRSFLWFCKKAVTMRAKRIKKQKRRIKMSIASSSSHKTDSKNELPDIVNDFKQHCTSEADKENEQLQSKIDHGVVEEEDFEFSPSPTADRMASALNIRAEAHLVLHVYRGIYVYRVDRFEDFYVLGPTLGFGSQGEVRMCVPVQIIQHLSMDPPAIDWHAMLLTRQRRRHFERYRRLQARSVKRNRIAKRKGGYTSPNSKDSILRPRWLSPRHHRPLDFSPHSDWTTLQRYDEGDHSADYDEMEDELEDDAPPGELPKSTSLTFFESSLTARSPCSSAQKRLHCAAGRLGGRQQSLQQQRSVSLHHQRRCGCPNHDAISSSYSRSPTGDIDLADFVYAVKISPQEDWDLHGDVYSRAHYLGSLRHPHVLRHRALYEDGLNDFLVVDMANGPNLMDYLNQKERLEESEAKRLFRQILDAIAYIHREKIVHRDIKLENFTFAEAPFDTEDSIQNKKENDASPLYDEQTFNLERALTMSCNQRHSEEEDDNSPLCRSCTTDNFCYFKKDDDSMRNPSHLLLLDFGLACHERDISDCRPDGTPMYMAPELFTYRDDEPYRYDSKIDLWGAGVILHQLLSGEAPFGREGPWVEISEAKDYVKEKTGTPQNSDMKNIDNFKNAESEALNTEGPYSVRGPKKHSYPKPCIFELEVQEKDPSLYTDFSTIDCLSSSRTTAATSTTTPSSTSAIKNEEDISPLPRLNAAEVEEDASFYQPGRKSLSNVCVYTDRYSHVTSSESPSARLQSYSERLRETYFRLPTICEERKSPSDRNKDAGPGGGGGSLEEAIHLDDKTVLLPLSLEGPKWESVSAEAKELILLLLSVDSNKRPTAEEALNHGWLS